MSFPNDKPDFVLTEVPPTSGPLTPAIDVGRDGVKWRQISGFVEVKPHVREGPNATKSTSLYVLCMFIYGDKFSLGWYDRRGVIISDDYDILQNLDILVSVILQLTTHMTAYDIGHDRSARLLEGHSYYQFGYPSFLVSTGAAGDTCLWKTEGPPIWYSLSLLGRGTATWRAVLAENKPGKKRIKSPLPGVAEFSLGDDVCIPLGRETNARVTVGTLRSLILNDDAGVPDYPVLHRLALETVGRPLWDADTTKDFILGSLAALKGHQGLVEQGILHRDMSPGNIFVGDPDCTEGWEGFVADLELASVAQPETQSVVSLHTLSPVAGQLNTRSVFLEETVPSSSEAPGAEITGTALFMAEELLSMMLLPDKKEIRPAQSKREVHHDLESFILVLFYSIMKRGLERRLWNKNPDEESQIRELYRTLFGGHTIRLIQQGRCCFFDARNPPVYLLDVLDSPTEQLLYGCWRLVEIQRSSNFFINELTAEVDQRMQWKSGSEERKVITYEQLYNIYDVVTSKLPGVH
ncbi:uncharacterized protein EDB93DRAFT_1339467 [Suillus bovinus]|uniref:uncharacterized protein n=1 Tax=Suillus bovinus TaxID=48563 RepID=UPI001B863038|nr:uncharacterized protein EDB93DRAFT_1339467 [Suillus bovinus]KAG2136358.1 hypothetical protein EDB93DRAFT_1339467 [Suillus bovinus]